MASYTKLDESTRTRSSDSHLEASREASEATVKEELQLWACYSDLFSSSSSSSSSFSPSSSSSSSFSSTTTTTNTTTTTTTTVAISND
nr:unnamed protein product [Spirometra erinaceieuropaei]